MQLVMKTIKDSFIVFRPQLGHIIDEFICALVEKHPQSRDILFSSAKSLDEKSQEIARYLCLLIDNCNHTEFFNACVLSLYQYCVRDKMGAPYLQAISATIDDLLASRLNDELNADTYAQWKMFFSVIMRKFSTLSSLEKPSVAPEKNTLAAQTLRIVPTIRDEPPVCDNDSKETDGWAAIPGEGDVPVVAEPPETEPAMVQTPIVEPSIAETPLMETPVVDSPVSFISTPPSPRTSEAIPASFSPVEAQPTSLSSPAVPESGAATCPAYDAQCDSIPTPPSSEDDPEKKGKIMNFPAKNEFTATPENQSNGPSQAAQTTPVGPAPNHLVGSLSFELPPEIKHQIRVRVKEALEEAMRKEIEVAREEVLKELDPASAVSELMRKVA